MPGGTVPIWGGKTPDWPGTPRNTRPGRDTLQVTPLPAHPLRLRLPGGTVPIWGGKTPDWPGTPRNTRPGRDTFQLTDSLRSRSGSDGGESALSPSSVEVTR